MSFITVYVDARGGKTNGFEFRWIYIQVMNIIKHKWDVVASFFFLS